MTFRINGPISPQIVAANQAQKTNNSAFRLNKASDELATDGAQEVRASQSVLGLDGLLAIQGDDQDSLSDKRRRQMQKSRFRLDQLDRLKLGLLGETPDIEALKGLEQDLKQAYEPVEDDELEALMRAIELRARVELAKRGMI